MPSSKVVPVVITQNKGDTEVVSAFVIAERAEKSKIQGWANTFDFELTEPILIDLSAGLVPEKLVDEILTNVRHSGSDGVVAASTEFLRRAGLNTSLPDALVKIGKQIWIADLGSLPLSDCKSA